MHFYFLMLALDLGVFNKKAHKIAVKEALSWSAVVDFACIIIQCFCFLSVWQDQGP